MTLEQEAKELISKYILVTRFFDISKGWVDDLPRAKDAAIISVDLVINEIHYIADEICMPLTDREIKRIDHYHQLKQQIETL